MLRALGKINHPHRIIEAEVIPASLENTGVGGSLFGYHQCIEIDKAGPFFGIKWVPFLVLKTSISSLLVSCRFYVPLCSIEGKGVAIAGLILSIIGIVIGIGIIVAIIVSPPSTPSSAPS